VLYQSVTRLRPAKTAEWIEVLFGVETLGVQGTLLDVRLHLPTGRGRANEGNGARCTAPTYLSDGATFDAAIA